MENKADIIGTIILIIITIGIISYTVIDHTGISENKAQALVINNVANQYNINESEISINSINSTTFEGHSAYKIQVIFHAKNKTQNLSYIINTNNGSVSKL